MAWTSHPGLPGKVYIPEDAGTQQKKHPCASCFSCQWCDDTRCRLCRGGPCETEPAVARSDHSGCQCKSIKPG